MYALLSTVYDVETACPDQGPDTSQDFRVSEGRPYATSHLNLARSENLNEMPITDYSFVLFGAF